MVSLPPEAMVKVDGRLAAGRTPLRVDDVELKFPHHVTVTLPGYETWERDVNFDWGRKEVALHAVLTPLTGVLAVTSIPVGAEAIVNGRYRGRTPLELSDMLPTDSVTVELRLRGYRVERRVLPWNGRRRLELSVPLERARP